MKINENGITDEYMPIFDIVDMSYDEENEMIKFNVTFFIDKTFNSGFMTKKYCQIDINQRDLNGRLRQYKDILEEVITKVERQKISMRKSLEGINHFHMLHKMVTKKVNFQIF